MPCDGAAKVLAPVKKPTAKIVINSNTPKHLLVFFICIHYSMLAMANISLLWYIICDIVFAEYDKLQSKNWKNYIRNS